MNKLIILFLLVLFLTGCDNREPASSDQATDSESQVENVAETEQVVPAEGTFLLISPTR